MKKLLLALLFILGLALPATAQTIVSGTIADPNSLAYSGATLTVTQNGFVVPPGATLNVSGQFSLRLAAGSGYTFSASFAGIPYPFGTGPQTCSATNQTISGSTQTISFTCPALTVNFATGGGTPCITTALSFQFNNAGAFGCVPDFTFTAPHTMALGASGIFTITGTLGLSGAAGFTIPTSAGFTASSTLNSGIDSTNDNFHFWNGSADVRALGVTSTPTSGHVLGALVTSGSLQAQDLGPTGGGGTDFLECTLSGLVTGDYFGVNGSGVCTELVPGLTPVSITASGTTTMLSSYRGELVTAASTSGSQTFALPDGTTTGFTSNFYFRVCNHGTVGALSITNNSGSYTFNAAASPYSLPEGYCADISNNSTSTGWRLTLSPGLLAAGTGISLTQSQFGTTIAPSAVPLSDLATQGADTVVMNATGSSAAPTAVTMPTCAASGHADVYDPSTHTWSCNSIGSGSGSAIATVTQASQTAAISTFTLCAAATCGNGSNGQYRIDWTVWGSGTPCSSVTAGAVGQSFTWTDENGTTHSISGNAPLQWDAVGGPGTTVFHFATSLAGEGASGTLNISTNGTIIQAATTYAACTTGTGTYNVLYKVFGPF